MSEIPPPSGGSYTPPPPPPGSYTPPPPPPGGSYNPPPPSGVPGSDRGLMLFLCYFGIFALIPLLTKKEDREVQWHAKNGLVLAIAWCVVWIGFQIIDAKGKLKYSMAWVTSLPVSKDNVAEIVACGRA